MAKCRTSLEDGCPQPALAPSLECTQQCEDPNPAEVSSQNMVFLLGIGDKEKGLWCHRAFETIGSKAVSRMARAMGSVACSLECCLLTQGKTQNPQCTHAWGDLGDPWTLPRV